MRKYKVGDRVIVRKDLEVDEDYGICGFAECMAKWKGKEVGIKALTPSGGYYIEEDTVEFTWTDEMFEDPVEFLEGCIVYDGVWYRKVLGVCGGIRFLSMAYKAGDLDNKMNRYGIGHTVQEMKRAGYKIYEPKPKLTHKQLEEKLGYEFELEEELSDE